MADAPRRHGSFVRTMRVVQRLRAPVLGLDTLHTPEKLYGPRSPLECVLGREAAGPAGLCPRQLLAFIVSPAGPRALGQADLVSPEDLRAFSLSELHDTGYR